MNAVHSVYSLADGQLTGQSISVPEAELQSNTPPGCGLVEGLLDAASWRVDLASGQAVAKQPEQPADTEHITWVWDEALHRHMPQMTLAGSRAQLSAALIAELDAIDRSSGTDRAVRELLLTSNISEQALARIGAIEARAVAVRALMGRCTAAITLAELESIDADLQAQKVVQVTA